MKRSRLRSDPQKAAEWTQRSRGSLRSRSRQKEAERRTEAEVRAMVFARDRSCVLHKWFLLDLPPCFGVLTPHHRRKASAGGGYSMANLQTLCAFHNTDVEDRPAFYREHFPWLVVREGDEEWESLGRRANRGHTTY